MAIEFNCPECRQMMKAGEEFAGKKARCPSCMAVVSVPLRSTMDRVEPPADVPPDAPPATGENRPIRRADADRPRQGGSRPFSVDKPDAEPTRRRGPMPRWDDDEEEVRPARLRSGSTGSGPRTRPCPMCGEAIEVRARRCGFCGEAFDDEGRVGGRSPLAYGGADTRASAITSVVLGLIAIAVTFLGIATGTGPAWLCCMPFLPFIGIWQGIRSTNSSLPGVAIAGIVLNVLVLMVSFVFVMVRGLTV